MGIPEDVEPPEPVEAELIIDGFVVTGSRDTTVTIKGEEMGEGMLPPMEGEAPMEPAEPVEEEYSEASYKAGRCTCPFFSRNYPIEFLDLHN